MRISDIRCSLPCCSPPDEKHTRGSLIFKITACVLGIIALLIGALALCGTPGLHALRPVYGGVLIGLGGLSLMLGLCLKVLQAPPHVPAIRTEGQPEQPRRKGEQQVISQEEDPHDQLDAIYARILSINHSLKEIDLNGQEAEKLLEEQQSLLENALKIVQRQQRTYEATLEQDKQATEHQI